MSMPQFGEIDRDTIGLGFAALHRGADEQFNEEWCQCDPSVGMEPCEYCAIYYALKRGRALEAEVERLTELVILFKVKRAHDGLNGRMWKADTHLEAETEIARLIEEGQG